MDNLLMDVEAKSQQAEIYHGKADSTLESLRSGIESYQNEGGVSGWDIFSSAAAGAGAGLLGNNSV